MSSIARTAAVNSSSEPADQEPFLPQDPGNLDPGEVNGLRGHCSVDEFLLQLSGTLKAILVDEPAQEHTGVNHVGVSPPTATLADPICPAADIKSEHSRTLASARRGR